MDHAQRGAMAASASDFPAAIQEYTSALVVNPHAADYYIKRSTAYSRVKPADGGPDLAAALQDAEMAVVIGMQRGRREPVVAGQMRRGIVLYQLGKIGDAGFIFGVVRGKVGQASPRGVMEAVQESMGGGNPVDKKSPDVPIRQELDIWDMKLKAKVASVDPSDESMKVTAKETPDIKVPDPEELKKTYQTQLDAMTGASGVATTPKTTSLPGTNGSAHKRKEPSATNIAQSAAPAAEGDAATKSATQVPGPTKVRHEWYQSSDTVTITLYAKGAPKDETEVSINEYSLYITFPLPTGSDCAFTLDPLYDAVDIHASRYSIMSTKVEISLRKKQPGRKWAALERTVDEDSVVVPAVSGTHPSSDRSSGNAPAYPTSSRKGVKDWDKVASSLGEKKGKEKSSSKEGDDAEADSDTSEYGGDQVDGFFKKLYSNADPDTQRAMVKSFYESEGTALNTNWSEVGKKKVDVHPPSGD